MVLRNETKLNPAFEQGGTKVFVEWEGRKFEIAISEIEEIPTTGIQRGM